MKIIQTTQKPTAEKPCSNSMPTLTFMDTLQKRISQAKNTHMEFNGRYINITTDIIRLSKDILACQINAESGSLEKSGFSAKSKNKGKDIIRILDQRLKEWYESEKITALPSIICRESDKEAGKINMKLPDRVKKEIIDLINEKYINISTLEKSASVISMMNPLKSDNDLIRKINMLGIKKALINDIKKEEPEKFKFLVEHFNKEKIKDEKAMTPEELFIYHDIPIVREIAGKMTSDVYYSIIENIYSILFNESETRKAPDFQAIKREIKNEIENENERQKPHQKQKEKLNKERVTDTDTDTDTNTNTNTDTDNYKRDIYEDLIRRNFYSEIKAEPYSLKEEREKLFETLDKSLRNESLSDQRATFNPGIKSTSLSSEEELKNLFDILENNHNTSDLSDQRAVLKNK